MTTAEERHPDGKCPSCGAELRICARTGGDMVACVNYDDGPNWRLVGNMTCKFVEPYRM